MVTVLMSTYNGEKYLRQQIDSILKQKNAEVQLYIRDDGSHDGTLSILKEYSAQGLLTWYSGENKGPQLSFMELLTAAPDSDFYAFADQDDIWLEDKLSTAVESLESKTTPALYFCQTQMVDSSGKEIPTPAINPLLTFPESVIYAYVSGCTMVINKKLREVIISSIPNDMPMLHDFWCYNVAQAIGAEIVFDKQPHILYRQHEGNVLGLHDSRIEEWRLRIKRIFSQGASQRSRNAEILLETLHGIMPQDRLRQLETFTMGKHSFYKRMSLLLSDQFSCGSRKTLILFKLSVLLNRY